MENEVKNEGQESLDNTVITTAPVVEDVIEETPAVEAMPSLEPIPAEPAPVAEPVVEPAPVVEPVVEAIPAVEPVVEPVAEPAPVEAAPAVEPVAEPAPVEEVEPAVEAAPAVDQPAAPVEAAPAPVDEVKGVEVNPNVVTEAVPGQSTDNNVAQAPAVDLNGGDFKESVDPKSKANSWPKIIAAIVIFAILILFAINLPNISDFITNLDGNGGNVEPTAAPSPSPEVVAQETKLVCTKSVTADNGNVTQETYTYNGMDNKLNDYSLVVSVSNPDATILQSVVQECEAEKTKYLSEAGYSLVCELNTNAVKTLTVDTAAYDLYLAANTDATQEEVQPEEGAEAAPAMVEVPAPEFGLSANMEDIKTQKTALGYTCE